MSSLRQNPHPLFITSGLATQRVVAPGFAQQPLACFDTSMTSTNWMSVLACDSCVHKNAIFFHCATSVQLLWSCPLSRSLSGSRHANAGHGAGKRMSNDHQNRSSGTNSAQKEPFHEHVFCTSCIQPASRRTDLAGCFFLPCGSQCAFPISLCIETL